MELLKSLLRVLIHRFRRFHRFPVGVHWRSLAVPCLRIRIHSRAFAVPFMRTCRLLVALTGGLGILLVVSCQPETSNYKEQLYVYATLMPDLGYQSVIVDRTRSVDEPTPDSLEFGVSGATVTLRRFGADDSLILTESPDTTGLYHDYDATSRPWIRACSTYQLSVSCAVGEESFPRLDGEKRIRVPGQFSITRPRFGESFSDTNLPVFSWQHSDGAAGYRVYAVDTLYRKRGFLRRLPVATTDTLIDIQPFYQGLFDSTSAYIIRVFALDSNLVRLERGAVDTIGPDILAVIGAQAVASTIINYYRVRP